MSKKFPNSDKLATMQEMRYLLLEVLDRPDPISWYDLSFSCKELSFNFAFAFENTITFLEALSIIEINKDKSVIRTEADYSILNSEQAFGHFILRKIIKQLEEYGEYHAVFNQQTVISNSDNNYVVEISKVPEDFKFIRVLFLNLGIAILDKNLADRFFISETYRNYFTNEIVGKFATNKQKEPALKVDFREAKPLKKPTFFISYASPDEIYKDQLQNHFSGLVDQGIIESWDGRAILPGQDWDEEVKNKLEQAEVVLFLVSSDFMASQYIKDVEIKKTIERHNKKEVRIIPIIVRPCDYKSLPIGKYQALPKDALPISEWASKDKAYYDIVKQIRKILSLEHT